MVDFGKSDKMIKVSGKVDKSTLTMDPCCGSLTHLSIMDSSHCY